MEYDGGCQRLRHEDGQELTEDMTERKQVEESKRVNQLFVFRIFRDLTFKRLKIRQHITVSDYDSFRIGRCPGSKDDLKDVATRERMSCYGNTMSRDNRREIFQRDHRHFAKQIGGRRHTNCKYGIDLQHDTAHEVGR